jgi:hypothetical protein
VTGAACNISFDTPTGWAAVASMTYNGTSKFYYYNRSFNFSGTYNFLVQCSKVHYSPQNATSNYTITAYGPYVATDANYYSACNIVFYKVWVYDANDSLIDSNLTINIYNTSPSLKNTTNVSTGNGGTGIYLGNYTLPSGADLGKWLITALAPIIKGTQNFFVGTSSAKWKIDIDFTPDSLVYRAGTSVTMNFTVWTKEGVRQTGLLPGNITAYVDSTNITSNLTASGEGYIYTYNASAGSHLVNVSSGNVTNIRGFNVR